MNLVQVRVIEKAGYSATVVSVLPWTLTEKKPGIYPGEFIIKGVDDPSTQVSILGIGESVYYVPLALERPAFMVREPAIAVAASIVNDYCNSILAATVGAHPGMFAVNEPLTVEAVEEEYPDALAEARECQARWLERLVRIADDDWQHYRQHRVITDIQRRAAKVMKLNREWATDLKLGLISNCPMCRAIVDPVSVICPNCRFILNRDKFDEFKDQFDHGPQVVSVGKK